VVVRVEGSVETDALAAVLVAVRATV
jgi:hypothetical protein